MRHFRSFLVASLLAIASQHVANANEIILPPQPMLPMSSALYDDMGRLGTKLQTGTVKDSKGALARGEHEVQFFLDLASPYALSVEGHRVEPGQTVTLIKNLTLSDSVLTLNVFPADGNIAGTANYTISIPSISVKLCPAGMSETTSTCTKVNFTDPELVCGNGYSLNPSNQCERVISVPKMDGCGTGFTKAGDTCVGGLETPAVKQCEAGFSLNANSECEKQIYSKSSHCEVGYSVLDGICQRKIEVNRQTDGCPEGSVPHLNFSDVCILTIKKPKKIYCQNTETTTTEQCHVVNEQKVCLKLDESLAACQIKTYSAAKLDCPTNATLLNGKCIIDEHYRLSVSCPAGFTALAGTTTCQKVETKAPALGCEDSYTLSGSNCSKTTTVPIQSCQTGYEYVDNTCRATKSPALSCASGYTLNGSVCEQPQTVGAVPVCADSYDWNGTHCERAVTVQGTASCPGGYTINSSTGMCIATVDVAPEGFNCPTGYGPTANWNNTKDSRCHKTTYSVCPDNFHNLESDPQSCFINEGHYYKKSNVNEPCPANFPHLSLDGGNLMCIAKFESKTYYPYTLLSCPAGSTRFGSNCFSDTVTVASVGYHSNSYYTYQPATGLMRGTSILPPTSVVCPAGFTQSVGANCQMRDLKAAIAFACEGSWTLDGQTCKTVYKSEPITSCGSGYTAKTNTLCYANSATNNIGNCPSGMAVSGTTCAGLHTVAAQTKCESDWLLTAPNTCTKTTTASPTIGCPAGSTDYGTTCTAKLLSTPQSICQSPYTYSNNDKTCRYDLTTPKL